VLTPLIAAVLLFSLFGLVPFIGTSFLPSSSNKVASIHVTMPPWTSQEATLTKATDLEGVIRQATRVQLPQTQVGGGELPSAEVGRRRHRHDHGPFRSER
jgi:HAE1 family hydrophobic/amphiphilic exporter-1